MKKKILIVIGVIVLLFMILVGYFVYKDLKEEELLKKEVIELSNKDLLNDDFSISIKTNGDYSYVENAIKKYYKELSDSVKSLNYVLDNDELINILSVDNLQKERPNFVNSHSMIQSVKKSASDSLSNIVKLCSEDYIKNLLDKDKVSDYYVDFYKKLMYTEQDLKYFKEVQVEMEELSGNLNLFLDKVDEILNMLQRNNDSWFIEDGQIYFESNELVDEYNKLYQELKSIASDKLNGEKYYNSTKDNVSV